MSVNFEVVEHPARACAALMVGAATRGGSIVLAGGSTPRAAYEHFVHAVAAVGLDLDQTTFWIGDERCVDPDDDRANSKMIQGALVGAARGPDPGPRRADPRRARSRMRPPTTTSSGCAPPGRRSFDLVLLGIGPDGHTASLFPEQPSLFVRDRLASACPRRDWRRSCPASRSRCPRSPARATSSFWPRAAARPTRSPRRSATDAEAGPHIPASMLAPETKLLTVLIDPDAAAGLDAPGVAR